jgi:hypothetical protein
MHAACRVTRLRPSASAIGSSNMRLQPDERSGVSLPRNIQSERSPKWPQHTSWAANQWAVFSRLGVPTVGGWLDQEEVSNDGGAELPPPLMTGSS